MSATDISAVVARIKNRIETVPYSGPVYAEDIYARDDLRDMLVSNIAGQDTLRAWWITGPTMSGQRTTQTSTGYIERHWTYWIHGIEGIRSDGTTLQALRDMAVLVSDAIDSDLTLGNTCHRTNPCSWPVQPAYRTASDVIVTGYVELMKPVVTLSTP